MGRLAIALFCIASLLGALNFIATTLDLRTKGMSLARMPLSSWAWFMTSVISLLAFAVLLPACIHGTYWLYVTAGLGCAFVLGQILAWRNLVAQGLFLATNPSSSFFYVFTALHAVHLLGGIGGLVYVLRKLVRTNGSAENSGLGAFSIYWHFMDILWVYLLLLLAIRI